MLIRKCDRCGKTIENNFWKIKVFEEVDGSGANSSKGVSMNIKNNLATLLDIEKEYCEKCIDSILEFINLDVREEIN